MYSTITRYIYTLLVKKREECLTIKIYLTMAKKTEKAQKTNVAVFEPYRVVLNEGKHVIVMGNAIISRLQFDTQKEAIDYIKRKPYELIYNSCMFLMEQCFNVTRKEIKQ